MNRTEKKKNDADDFLRRVQEDYKTSVDDISNEYENQRGKYNGLINTLNSQRVALKDEIRNMYDFLHRLGNIGKELTIFDYKQEDPAPVLSASIKPEINAPDCKKGLFKRKKNNIALLNYNAEILRIEQKYVSDISAKRLSIRYLEIATNIARIYFETVVYIRDFIKTKIVPELSFIYSSLIADGVLNEVVSGGDASRARISDISEYKDTNKDIHYRFVQNVHDFYQISTAFFKKTILTNFLADKRISVEEKESFKKSVEQIYEKANAVVREKVL